MFVSDRRPSRPLGETRLAVAQLLAQGLSQAAIARALGVSGPTVCFHMRKLGHPAREQPARRYDWPAIRAHYESGRSARECQEEFGFGRNAWAEAVARGAIEPRARAEPLENLLAQGRSAHRNNLKLRLIAEGVKEARCELCGCREWQGKPIALQLHHVNGNGADNRLANLQLLCPNCHSQTDTWGARNRRLRPPADGGGVADTE